VAVGVARSSIRYQSREDDDPFFEAIDRIVEDRSKHTPRVFLEEDPADASR